MKAKIIAKYIKITHSVTFMLPVLLYFFFNLQKKQYELTLLQKLTVKKYTTMALLL